MIISASILNCNFLELAKEIKKVEEAGIDSFHLDIMDGHFVPNLTFGTSILNALRKIVKKPLFSHLMVLEPLKMIDWFANGSEGIMFHIEAGSIFPCIERIREKGLKVGIALNPPTPIKEVLPYLKHLDEVLVMSVNPGFGGQKFIPEALNKIREIKKVIEEDGLNTVVSVDGGVNLDNALSLKEAGCDKLVVGSAIFEAKNYSQVIKQLKAL